jgi:hypothetical protein
MVSAFYGKFTSDIWTIESAMDYDKPQITDGFFLRLLSGKLWPDGDFFTEFKEFRAEKRSDKIDLFRYQSPAQKQPKCLDGTSPR